MNPSDVQAGSSTPTASTPHHPARGFAQKFGLHPGMAALTLAVDSMLFAGELASAGLGVILSVPVSAAVGLLTYRAQLRWFGDDADSAAIKGGCVALLTAIPSALPCWLYLPAGFIGLLRRR